MLRYGNTVLVVWNQSIDERNFPTYAKRSGMISESGAKLKTVLVAWLGVVAGGFCDHLLVETGVEYH